LTGGGIPDILGEMAIKDQQEYDDRLGTLLIRRGIITAQQLDQAVQCQVLFGGRLGSNLLELGFVTEDQLRDLLVEKGKLPAVGRERLADLSADLIKLVPRGLASKHKLVPVSLAEGVLSVAMLDPYRESAVRALTEATGLKISPLIALEMDLAWALEKYYAVKRDARFVNLDRYMTFKRETETKKKKAAKKPKSEPNLAEPIFPDPQSITALEGAPKTLDDFWDRVGRSGHPEYMLPRVLADLEAAQSRDEIARIILDFASLLFVRSLLFVVNEEMLFGWDARGEGFDSRVALAIMLPLTRRSMFKTVVDTGAYFLGPVPEATINKRFLEALGTSRPKTVLVLPIFVGTKTAAILYGDMGDGQEVTAKILPLQRVLNAAGQCFQRLILRQKSENIRG
jgi:hypothetical protein